ncbi:MAG TPA: ATPase V [Phycisphaerales bacterium]|nr:ATPase V [Phycisphaerales bacterium]
MFTTQMTQLFAVALRRDCERVTEVLLRAGVMQFVRVSDLAEGPAGLATVRPEGELTEITDLRQRIEGVLRTGSITPRPPDEKDLSVRTVVDMDKERKALDRIAGECESLRERQRGISQEILRLEDISRQIDLYGLSMSEAAASPRHSFISMQIGRIPLSRARDFEGNLKPLPSLAVPMGQEQEMAHYLLIYMKRDREQLEKILARAGWMDVELPAELRSVKKDAARELTARLDKLRTEQKKLETTVAETIRKEAERLSSVWTTLRVNELLHQIQAHFKSSARTVLFTGWLPSEKRESLTREIRKACGGRCYVEWRDLDSRDGIQEDVPVEFRNPRMLAPFEMLVSNFGIPRYGTIDPTPFVMPLYLAMFGLMFADVGQGIVLAVLGMLGTYLLKGRKTHEGLYRLCWLIVWCGLSAVLFGALFGAYFGMRLFEPLWFDFHGIVAGHGSHSRTISDLFDILAITIYFGITVIALGLAFNWINMIRAGLWIDLLFDKGGVLGAWIYAGGIYIAFFMVSHDYKALPAGNTLFMLVGLPAVLLFLKEPWHYFTHGEAHGGKKPNLGLAFMSFLMQWIVELLEIFSGYLSNTLSFMRVAGLGIAHVCLMISFFTLAGMTSGAMSVLILVIGNVLVIGLEGLLAGIQALRLSYYEFFTKFFHGTGKLYSPISLRSEN